MSETVPALQPPEEFKPARGPLRPWVRVTRYIAIRTLWLGLMFIVGMYLVVIVSNLGGYIDDIYRDRIAWTVGGIGQQMRGVPIEEKTARLDEIRAQMEEAYGLNQPFLLRCVRWLYAAITLDIVTPQVRAAFPNTLLLVCTSYLLLFFIATFLSLYLARRYGSIVDRLVTALSPLSAAPSWVHGILLVAIFSVELRLLPFSGMYDAYPPETRLGYVLVVLKHMVLPVTAILLSALFQCVYAWRTFFLIHAAEDYVELAKAKGLPDRMLERRHLLRPALPYFVTSFALLLVSFWQEAIVLEYFFDWPGIGRLYIDSTRGWGSSPQNVTAIAVVFAYVLAITVFVLDITYALLDPRIRIAGEATARPARRKVAGRRFRAPSGEVPQRVSPTTSRRPAPPPARAWKRPRARHGLLEALRELARYPSAVIGLTIILALVGVSIYTVIAIPYDQAVKLWMRGSTRLNPRASPPAWTNWFRRDPLPETIILSSERGTASKEVEYVTADYGVITITAPFDHASSTFPQDILISITTSYDEKLPRAFIYLQTPDGREVLLSDMRLRSTQTYVVAQDEKLERRLGQSPIQGLFADPAAEKPVPLPGRYTLLIKIRVYEADVDVDVQLVVYGQVFGLAGTDIYRRDLSVALLWGTPVALSLGLLGAVSSTLIAITIAAAGVWYGGWVDRAIQWVSEVNMLLPILPLAIMVYVRHSKNIWAILAVIIVLSSFGRALKNLRAALLQVREQPYIEAAQSYGAGNLRIIGRYLVPRVIPTLVPQLVILVPGFVFLEATLAIVGVSDLYLPTWGKMIHDALTSGVLRDYYYWALEPIALLLLMGLAFAMVGYSLDRVFNPRLRTMRGGGDWVLGIGDRG